MADVRRCQVILTRKLINLMIKDVIPVIGTVSIKCLIFSVKFCVRKSEKKRSCPPIMYAFTWTVTVKLSKMLLHILRLQQLNSHLSTVAEIN